MVADDDGVTQVGGMRSAALADAQSCSTGITLSLFPNHGALQFCLLLEGGNKAQKKKIYQ